MNVEKNIDLFFLHVIYGFSKDFGSAGLPLGAIVTRSKSMLQTVDSVIRFSNTSGPSLTIASAMLVNREWCQKFVTENRIMLAEAYRHITAGLRDISVGYPQGIVLDSLSGFIGTLVSWTRYH